MPGLGSADQLAALKQGPPVARIVHPQGQTASVVEE